MAKHMSKAGPRLEGRTAAAKPWYMARRKVFNQMAIITSRDGGRALPWAPYRLVRP